jgi:hypothetical protein
MLLDAGNAETVSANTEASAQRFTDRRENGLHDLHHAHGGGGGDQ